MNQSLVLRCGESFFVQQYPLCWSSIFGHRIASRRRFPQKHLSFRLAMCSGVALPRVFFLSEKDMFFKAVSWGTALPHLCCSTGNANVF